MRTETITIYKFDELPTERAKERARDWWRECADLSWSDESLDSIRAFCKHFGVTLKSWSVGPYAPFDFSTNAEQHHFRGKRLRDFKRDHMPTGYCLDCSLWMTFYDVFKGSGDAKAAFDAAMRAGFADWRADMESQLEDDYIDDVLAANEFEFTEEGKYA
jgi:hypothetical protein